MRYRRNVEQERQSLADFIEGHGIRMTYVPMAATPERIRLMGREMDHWRCTLWMGNRRMTVNFSMGYGHGGKHPTVDRVLGALADDAAGYDNVGGDFDEWVSSYGYEDETPEEERKARGIFRAVETQTEKLQRFLGDDAYQELLWETERE